MSPQGAAVTAGSGESRVGLSSASRSGPSASSLRGLPLQHTGPSAGGFPSQVLARTPPMSWPASSALAPAHPLCVLGAQRLTLHSFSRSGLPRDHRSRSGAGPAGLTGPSEHTQALGTAAPGFCLPLEQRKGHSLVSGRPRSALQTSCSLSFPARDLRVHGVSLQIVLHLFQAESLERTSQGAGVQTDFLLL